MQDLFVTFLTVITPARLPLVAAGTVLTVFFCLVALFVGTITQKSCGWIFVKFG